MNLCIIQARMCSTRLPGKVMKEICGKTLLQYQLERVKKAKLIDEIIIATTQNEEDDVLEKFCVDNSYNIFRGSQNDVLDRYYQAAKKYNADTIIRLTGDCPFSDPDIIDNTIRLFLDSKVDYAANTVPPETRKFPDGTDVEVFSFTALTRAWKDSSDRREREHVTFYFWKSLNGFKMAQLSNDEDWAKYRLTVDYPEDLEVINFVISQLNQRHLFGFTEEIIQILNENPEIIKKNSHYYFGIGWGK